MFYLFPSEMSLAKPNMLLSRHVVEEIQAAKTRLGPTPIHHVSGSLCFTKSTLTKGYNGASSFLSTPWEMGKTHDLMSQISLTKSQILGGELVFPAYAVPS